MMHDRGKRRPRRGLIAALMLLFATLALAGFLGYRYLRVENISISGNSAISTAEIVAQSGIVMGTHFLEFDSEAVKRNLEANPYIVVESVGFSFPDTVAIEIKERKVEAVIKSIERSIFIDGECRVLDISTDADLSGILLVTGVAVTGAATGETVAVVDDYQLEALKMLLDSLKRTESYSAYASADFTFSVDIWLTTPEGMAVRVGQAHMLDEKLNAVSAVMTELYGRGVRTGTLSATNPSAVTYSPPPSFGPQTDDEETTPDGFVSKPPDGEGNDGEGNDVDGEGDEDTAPKERQRRDDAAPTQPPNEDDEEDIPLD